MAKPKEDALTRTYDLMLWLFPQIGKFPREYRFILGDRLDLSGNTGMSCAELTTLIATLGAAVTPNPAVNGTNCTNP